MAIEDFLLAKAIDTEQDRLRELQRENKQAAHRGKIWDTVGGVLSLGAGLINPALGVAVKGGTSLLKHTVGDTEQEQTSGKFLFNQEAIEDYNEDVELSNKSQIQGDILNTLASAAAAELFNPGSFGSMGEDIKSFGVKTGLMAPQASETFDMATDASTASGMTAAGGASSNNLSKALNLNPASAETLAAEEGTMLRDLSKFTPKDSSYVAPSIASDIPMVTKDTEFPPFVPLEESKSADLMYNLSGDRYIPPSRPLTPIEGIINRIPTPTEQLFNELLNNYGG